MSVEQLARTSEAPLAPQQIQERRHRAMLERQLAPLGAYIEDPAITDILINADGRVWCEAHGKGLYPSGASMAASAIESLIDTAAALLGGVADHEHPIVEGEIVIRGMRFEGLRPPVVEQPCIALRKPAQVLYSVDDYVRDRIITARQAEIFREGVDSKLNFLIAGGTGTGKTTLGGALLNEMALRGAPHERYVIIEDTREIRCPAQNVVQLHTSETADMGRLVRATMRLRPDRIIVGEVRGGEALALLKAWLTGHPGGVTTIHANSCRAALTRLSSLVQEAGVPPQLELIAETINLIAFIARTPAGRRVTEMVRVEGCDPQSGFKLLPLAA